MLFWALRPGTQRVLWYWHWALIFPLGHCSAPGATLFLAQVQEVDECLVESSRSTKACVGHKRWAYKTPMQLQSPSAKTVANVSLRRNLMSAPPVM